MQEPSTEISAPGFYLGLRIASWVALVAIVTAMAWAAVQAVANWNVIQV